MCFLASYAILTIQRIAEKGQHRKRVIEEGLPGPENDGVEVAIGKVLKRWCCLERIWEEVVPQVGALSEILLIYLCIMC